MMDKSSVQMTRRDARAREYASQIINILRDFIANSSISMAMDKLTQAFYESQAEIITQDDREFKDIKDAEGLNIYERARVDLHLYGSKVYFNDGRLFEIDHEKQEAIEQIHKLTKDRYDSIYIKIKKDGKEYMFKGDFLKHLFCGDLYLNNIKKDSNNE